MGIVIQWQASTICRCCNKWSCLSVNFKGVWTEYIEINMHECSRTFYLYGEIAFKCMTAEGNLKISNHGGGSEGSQP